VKKRALVVGGATLLIVVIIVASIRGGGGDAEKVYVTPAESKQIEAVVTASGPIDPKVKVNISAHVIGKIEKLYFEEGDAVRRGQKLVELEKPLFTAQRDRAVAELANRRIEVRRAEAGLNAAEITFKRAESLQRQGIQAQQLFDQARVDLANARAAYASALEGVRQAEATVRQANEDLSRTTILSPLDGKVVQLNAREGEVVVTGTMNNPGSVIAVIADLSQILVEAEVGETEIVGIRPGQPARITVDAVPDKEYAGHVAEIGSSAAIRQTGGSGIRYFKVKVAIDDPDENLRPGMTSQVAIVTSTVPNAVTVPIQAVVERVPAGEEEEDADAPKEKFIFLARDGKAERTAVKTGISDATHVAIATGVKPGDPVITGPFRTLQRLKDEVAIEVVKEEGKTDERPTAE
jgi:HlyD family secretion protein